MKTVTIHDAKTNLSKYVASAKQGKKVYIGGYGKAEVMLVKIPPEDNKRLNARNFSALKGLVAELDDSFNEQTDKVIESMMSGE